MHTDSWISTDEEWYEVCATFIEVSNAFQALEAILLADNPPSLRELWQATESYQHNSERFFQAVRDPIRARLNLSEQQTYPS